MMQFLFHTAVEYNGGFVYYNIHRDNEHYYAEVLNNPNAVKEAKEFRLKKIGETWQSSIMLPNRVITVVGEEIDRFLE